MTEVPVARQTSNASIPVWYPLLTPLPHPPRRIAVFRALYLGDLLLAVPALRALRLRFPDAEITLIGLAWAESFARRFHRYIDRFVEFAGYPGIAEVAVDEERTRAFVLEQQHYGYDLVLQMHGSGRTSNPCVLAFGGQATVGYYEQRKPRDLLLALPYPHVQHEIERNLALAMLVGCTELDRKLEFPLLKEDHMEAAALLRQLPHAGRPWIGIHPGARPPSRRWPVEYFASVADALVQRFGAQMVLTGGVGEQELVRAVVNRMQAPVLNVAGQTSLGGLAALLSQLDLFISNDTGPAHVACAVDTPSITLFGPADYRRWTPLEQARHIGMHRPVVCSPCSYWECPIDHRCLRSIHPQTVVSLACEYLSEQPKRKTDA